MFNQLLLGTTASYAAETIVTLVSFVLLMLALKKFAWKPLKAIMDERQKMILANMDHAENAQAEADRLLAEQKKSLEETRNESAIILNQAKEAAERTEKDSLKAAREEVKKMKVKAEKDIELERQQVLSGVKKDVSLLSVQIAEKLLGRELTDERQSELIDKFIERLDDTDGSK